MKFIKEKVFSLNRDSLLLLSLNIILILLLLFFISNRLIKSSDGLTEYFVLKDIRKLDLSDIKGMNIQEQCNLETENYLFLGDSITRRYDLEKHFKGLPVVNSGVEGNWATDILENMQDRVYNYNPTKVFLMIGTNQLEFQTEEEIFNSIIEIVEEIKKNRSFASVYIESIYPINKEVKNSFSVGKSKERIRNINSKLKEYSTTHNVYYIDVYSSLIDDKDNLKEEYTVDGLHLTDQAYEKVTEVLMRYIDC